MNVINKKIIDAIREACSSDYRNPVRSAIQNAAGLRIDWLEAHSDITDDEIVFAALASLASWCRVDVTEVVRPGSRAAVEAQYAAAVDLEKAYHHRIVECVRKGELDR